MGCVWSFHMAPSTHVQQNFTYGLNSQLLHIKWRSDNDIVFLHTENLFLSEIFISFSWILSWMIIDLVYINAQSRYSVAPQWLIRYQGISVSTSASWMLCFGDKEYCIRVFMNTLKVLTHGVEQSFPFPIDQQLVLIKWSCWWQLFMIQYCENQPTQNLSTIEYSKIKPTQNSVFLSNQLSWPTEWLYPLCLVSNAGVKLHTLVVVLGETSESSHISQGSLVPPAIDHLFQFVRLLFCIQQMTNRWPTGGAVHNHLKSIGLIRGSGVIESMTQSKGAMERRE